MLIGYARVSTLIKIRSTRSMPLMKQDAKDIYGKIFGANKKRKQLQEALDYMREGDTACGLEIIAPDAIIDSGD